MQVAELCVRNVCVAGPRDVVATLARSMEKDDVGTIVVVDGLRRPLGIVTDRDVALRCAQGSLDPRRAHAEEVMSGPVAWVHEDSSLEAALAEMARLRVRRLVVVDASERLAGMIALDDVLATAFDEGSAIGRVLRATMPGGAP